MKPEWFRSMVKAGAIQWVQRETASPMSNSMKGSNQPSGIGLGDRIPSRFESGHVDFVPPCVICQKAPRR